MPTSLQQEEAISLQEFHDPVKNILWYISHTDDRESVMLRDGTRLDLSPDPSGRWKLVWVRGANEIYSLWVRAEQFEEAVEVWQTAIRITEGHPELLSGITSTEFCQSCPIRKTCTITWQLYDVTTVDRSLALILESNLNEAHKGLHD